MNDHDSTLRELIENVRKTGYERPNIEFVNPEIRTVSYAAPSLYGRFVFNLDKAVEAYDRGEFIRGTDAALETEGLGKALEAVFMWRAKERWYQLTAREREVYWANIAETMKQGSREGSRQLGLFDARMSSQWDFVSIWHHTGLTSLDLQIRRLRELDFFLYFDVQILSGTSLDKTQPD